MSIGATVHIDVSSNETAKSIIFPHEARIQRACKRRGCDGSCRIYNHHVPHKLLYMTCRIYRLTTAGAVSFVVSWRRTLSVFDGMRPRPARGSITHSGHGLTEEPESEYNVLAS